MDNPAKKILQVEQQYFKLLGNTVRTYDAQRNLLCKAEQKAFKLKEQVTFFADEAKTKPLFYVQARSVIDIAATYDITDATSGQRLGSLRRKGITSTFVRDEWLVLDPSERQIGLVQEESSGLGMLRRYVDLVSLLIPQKFHIYEGEALRGSMQINRFFGMKLRCEIEPALEQNLGELMTLAIPSMLIIIEGARN